MFLIKRYFIFVFFISLFCCNACGQASSSENKQISMQSYYKSINGKSGAALKTELSRIIGNPQVLTYRELWDAFRKTDATPDGKVWDIYSDNPKGKTAHYFTFRKEQCGHYTAEGDCYNREHSFPKSWFYRAEPMMSDLFHIYPTDGFVNNKRSNYPYGEVGIFSYQSTNGSKLGRNTFGNYRGYVFEPIDEYKGDLARTYFYMITAYENQISKWRSPQLNKTTYPGFSDWALELFIKWHRQDPVSDKERARNEAVYNLQGNRNPYIDFPNLAEYVWGKAKQTPYRFDNVVPMPSQKRKDKKAS